MNDYHIELIALTRGSEGSRIITPNGHYSQKAPQNKKTVNSVGAGDAYTSILAIGYLQGLKVEEILSAATDFAARICEIDSAFTTDVSFYDNWRSIYHEVTIGY
jgi:fructokinase